MNLTNLLLFFKALIKTEQTSQLDYTSNRCETKPDSNDLNKLTPPTLNKSSTTVTPPGIQIPGGDGLNPYLGSGNGHQYHATHPYSHAFAYYNNMSLTPASTSASASAHNHHHQQYNHQHSLNQQQQYIDQHGKSYSDSPASSTSSPTLSSSSSVALSSGNNSTSPPIVESSSSSLSSNGVDSGGVGGGVKKVVESVRSVENVSLANYMTTNTTPHYNSVPKSTVNPNLKIKLMDLSLWHKFSQIGTEMIITKCGRWKTRFFFFKINLFILYIHIYIFFKINCDLFIYRKRLRDVPGTKVKFKKFKTA